MFRNSLLNSKTKNLEMVEEEKKIEISEEYVFKRLTRVAPRTT